MKSGGGGANLVPMKRTIFLALLAAVAAGCKAHMLETRGDKIQLLRTVAEKPGRGGVIRYLVTGPAAFKKARSADADAQMRKFCSGGYSVSAEGPRSKFGAAMPIGGKVSFEMDEYWYVAFDCAPPSR